MPTQRIPHRLVGTVLAAALASSAAALVIAGPASATPTPTVTNVSPASGTGGTSVTLTGNNFSTTSNVTCASQLTTVTFNGITAPTCQIISPNIIDVTAPSGPTGAATVVVTVNGTASSSTPTSGNTFTYTSTTTSGVPTVSGVSPAGGSTAGGTSVSITGSNFTGATSVTFGGIPATSFSVTSPSTISAIAPADSAGTVAVVVTSPSGSSSAGAVVGSNAFAYDSTPSVSSITPTSGAGGTTVTITGSGFLTTTGVEFGSVSATYTVISDTQLTAVAPTAASGTVAVTVTNSAGISPASSSDLFTYGPPTVSGITPNSGPPAGGTTVTITGTGFTNATSVLFGTTPATSFTVQGDTSITAIAPASSGGAVAVTVTNSAGASTTSVSYTYLQTPVTIGVAASTDPAVTGQTLTLSAQVSPAPTTGSLSFANGATVITGCANLPIVNGTAQCSATFTAGAVPLAAIYSGSTTYAPSISATVSLIVNKASTSTSLNAASGTPATVVAGSPISLSASVSPTGAGAGTPTGSVTFDDNGAPIAACSSMPISGTSVTCSASISSGGSHAITALYNGDANFAASTSGVLNESVIVPTVTFATTSATLKGVVVPITVTCKVSACSGTLELTTTVKKKVVDLGSVTFNHLSLARHTLDVRLDATGRKTLANVSRSALSVTAVASLKSGGVSTKKIRIS